MPINASSQNGPLSEAELDRLTDFLASRGGQAMNIEELDGFFAALLAGPDMVLPSEYLPLVLAGAAAETSPFARTGAANDILGLIMRHWNGIAATLRKGDVHLPILLEDDARRFSGYRLGSRLHSRYGDAQNGLGPAHER